MSWWQKYEQKSEQGYWQVKRLEVSLPFIYEIRRAWFIIHSPFPLLLWLIFQKLPFFTSENVRSHAFSRVPSARNSDEEENSFYICHIVGYFAKSLLDDAN